MLASHDVTYDALIVGGGPAGLSAALVPGRARRRVVVIDVGRLLF
jgi:thioredoxin reductase